jgi:hypothetical protein
VRFIQQTLLPIGLRSNKFYFTQSSIDKILNSIHPNRLSIVIVANDRVILNMTMFKYLHSAYFVIMSSIIIDKKTNSIFYHRHGDSSDSCVDVFTSSKTSVRFRQGQHIEVTRSLNVFEEDQIVRSIGKLVCECLLLKSMARYLMSNTIHSTKSDRQHSSNSSVDKQLAHNDSIHRSNNSAYVYPSTEFHRRTKIARQIVFSPFIEHYRSGNEQIKSPSQMASLLSNRDKDRLCLSTLKFLRKQKASLTVFTTDGANGIIACGAY